MLNVIHSIRDSLAKTRKSLADRIGSLVLGEKIDEEFLDELEEALIASDVGTQTTALVLADLKERFKRNELSTPAQVRDRLRQVLGEILTARSSSFAVAAPQSVVLVVGVNGTGKTTTIGKLAHRLQGRGKKVMLAAADTFRAAASEQLSIWGERAGIPVIKHKEGADPGAVVFDALAAAKARNTDVLIVDTAGRLHTKSNLMEELKKIRRIIAREVQGAPHETLLGLNLLAHGLAEHVGLGERVARQHVRDPHHLLLVGDDAVGRGEDLLQVGMRVAHLLAAELAVDEHQVHPGVQRTGAEQGVGGDQVVEQVAFHAAQRVGGERRLELEDPRRAARAQLLVDLRVLQIQRVHVDHDAVARLHHLHRVVDHGQRLQAQKVDLQHPDRKSVV